MPIFNLAVIAIRLSKITAKYSPFVACGLNSYYVWHVVLPIILSTYSFTLSFRTILFVRRYVFAKCVLAYLKLDGLSTIDDLLFPIAKRALLKSISIHHLLLITRNPTGNIFIVVFFLVIRLY